MNRLRLAVIALLSGVLLTPSWASAKAIEDVLLGTEAQDIVITVLADTPLDPPTVRTYEGWLRVRMYDTKDVPLLKIPGDGAVRSVSLINGSDQSADIVVTFNDKMRIAASDVRVERLGSKVTLRIAKALLTAKSDGSAAAGSSGAATALKDPMPAAPKKSVLPLGQPAPKPAPSGELGLAQKSGESSTMPILLSVTALLAGCYGLIRLVMKKQSIGGIPAIDVIAQKRLGPRHQLVVVRAFDRDYLLSIQGGQTTVVARSSRGKLGEEGELSTDDSPSMPSEGEQRDGELDLAPPSGSLRAPATASTPNRGSTPSKASTPSKGLTPAPIPSTPSTFAPSTPTLAPTPSMFVSSSPTLAPTPSMFAPPGSSYAPPASTFAQSGSAYAPTQSTFAPSGSAFASAPSSFSTPPSATPSMSSAFSTPPSAMGRPSEPFEDDEVTFGGELFKAALEQRERQRDETQANLRLEAARAEARAELARLEAERAEQAASIKPPTASTPMPDNDTQTESLAPRSADAMMSEAVSGLLRLRKASGR